jgi:hypothetical protein
MTKTRIVAAGIAVLAMWCGSAYLAALLFLGLGADRYTPQCLCEGQDPLDALTAPKQSDP